MELLYCECLTSDLWGDKINSVHPSVLTEQGRFFPSTVQKTVASATGLSYGKGRGSKIGQKGRGGSNNVSASVVEDRGQRNLSMGDQRQSSTKSLLYKAVAESAQVKAS